LVAGRRRERAVTLVVVSLAIGAWLALVLVAATVHHTNAWRAHLACPVLEGRTGTVLGREGECRYDGPAGDRFAEAVRPFSWFEPAWSFLGFCTVVVLATVLLGVLLRRRARAAGAPATPTVG
jgi:hypothetical protein